MADSFTTDLKIRMPQTGAYNNTWGQRLNADMMALFDSAITGRSQIALSGTTYSLAALANGAAAESRSFCLYFTGSPSGDVTVTLPASVTKKFYLIDNQCGQTITFTYSGSTDTVEVVTATRQLIWCDGTNCWPVTAAAADSDALGGIDAQYWARTGRTADEITDVTYLSNVYVNKVRNSAPWATVTEGVTTTIDCRDGNHQKLTLTGNRTMAAPTNPLDGQTILLAVKQDGTGGRTLTWNSVFRFAGGSSPVLTTIAARTDLFLMIYDSTDSVWLAAKIGSDVGAGSGASYNITISENTIDWNLAARLGALGGAATVTVTVAQGVIVQATTTDTPAMDLSGLPSGSTVNLYNYGYIIGKGGDGGAGGAASQDNFQQDTHMFDWGKNGGAGGNAISGVGSGRTLNVYNASGYIWGGGGGGGGGGADFPSDANVSGAGGGGGGGAGGGGGGMEGANGGGGQSPNARASRGAGGSTGPNGVGGTAGAGTSNGLVGFAGGDGGGFGEDGDVGVGPDTTIAGAAGVAGKAIELNGGSMGSFTGSSSPNVEGAVS